VKAFGTTPIANITKNDVNAWLATGKRSARTINNDRRTLVTLFNFAAEAEYLLEDVATQAEKSTIKKMSRDGKISKLAHMIRRGIHGIASH
jgi:hypothetical protein